MVKLEKLLKKLSKESNNLVLHVGWITTLLALCLVINAMGSTEISATDNLILVNIMMTCFVGFIIFLNEIVKSW